MVTPDSVKTGIAAGLACDHLEVLGDGQHFQAIVVSARFEGKSR
ncbi:MAG: BolA family transcriptional regulator, partial [Acidobacteria bacterium]|nr:BolA family transcriptional regulator [Acidobacteriota bacterium]